MFGYVRARRDTLPQALWTRYEEVYCGLCHTMGRRYGRFSRLFLNYDFVFLAMVLAPADAADHAECCRCVRHPIRGRAACQGGTWLETASGESVILTYWKLRDAIADGGFWARWGARILCLGLGRAYRRAKEQFPAFDTETARLLAELSQLEQEGCPSIDKTADRFACLLRGAAPQTGDQSRDRALEQLLYHLGRWIYLIDGVDDLAEDKAAGRYNPVAARFPDWTEEDRVYLRRSMDHSLSLAGAAFQLLEVDPWTAVVENILYSGLPSVEELVFSGKWREHQRNSRRNER